MHKWELVPRNIPRNIPGNIPGINIPPWNMFSWNNSWEQRFTTRPRLKKVLFPGTVPEQFLGIIFTFAHQCTSNSLNCRTGENERWKRGDVLFLQQEMCILLLCFKFHMPFHYGCTKYFLAVGGLHKKPTSFVAMCAQMISPTRGKTHAYLHTSHLHHSEALSGKTVAFFFSGKVPENIIFFKWI